LRAELEAARSATSAAERGGESPAQALVREHLAAEARVAALEAQLLGLERDLNSAQEATATALTQRETLKKSLTSVIEELKQQLQSVVEEYLSYKKTATAATTAADAARAQAEEALATHMRGCRGGDTAALQARIDELEGYTKSAYAEFSSMTKKLADEKALCAQKDKRIAELEGGGGTNGAAATAAASAASAAAAAAAKADGEKAALVQELSEERAYAAQRVSSLEALAAVAATSAATKDREMAALQAELKDLRDKMMKLALEYQAYRSETAQQLDQLGKGIAGNGSNAGSDVAALRGELGAAQSELADVRRQLSLVEVQRNDMRRLLWTMREAATGKGASAGDGDTTWREVMGDAAPDPLEQTAGRSEGASSAAATAAGSGSDTSSYSGGGVVDLRKVPPAADTTTTSAASDTTSTGGLFSFLSGSPRK